MDLALPTTKKEVQCLMDLFGFWRQHIIHLDLLLWPIYQATPKVASLVWGPMQEKTLQQGQTAVKACSATWILWFSRSNGPEVSVADKDAV